MLGWSMAYKEPEKVNPLGRRLAPYFAVLLSAVAVLALANYMGWR